MSSKVILKDVDSLLYVDTDVLFLRPMDDIWSLFKSFNSTQLAAMAPEHEVPKIGWYSRFARHPFYGVTGINSGVMLMNLTRIRRTAFKVSLAAWLPSARLKCGERFSVLKRVSRAQASCSDSASLIATAASQTGALRTQFSSPPPPEPSADCERELKMQMLL